MLTDLSLNNEKVEKNKVPTKNKKKKDEISLSKRQELNGRMNYPIPNQISFPINKKVPVSFDTGYYFNSIPINYHDNFCKPKELMYAFDNKFFSNELTRDNDNDTEFVENYYNDHNYINNPEIRDKTSKKVKGIQRKCLNNNNIMHYSNNFNDIYLNNIQNDHLTNSNKNFNNNNPNFNNISKSTVNNSKMIINKIPKINHVYSQSQPIHIPAMGFPFNFNPNPPFTINPIYPNVNNGNHFNAYYVNQNQHNANLLYKSPNCAMQQNFQNNFFQNNFSNNINRNNIAANNNLYDVCKNLKTCELNNEYFYSQNPTDEVVDKNIFLKEFADFKNLNISKSRAEKSYNTINLKNILDIQKKIKDKNKKAYIKYASKGKENSEFINFDNFEDILVENVVANKEDNLLVFSKKLSTVEEKKDGKSLKKNNYQVTIINGYKFKDDSEFNNNNPCLQEKIYNHLRVDVIYQRDSIAIKTNNKNNRDFLNYLEDPGSSTIEISKEKNYDNKYSSKETTNDNEYNENEFYDFNEIMIKNSNNKTPNITSEYYSIKLTSAGEKLKLELNIDKELYDSRRQNKKKVELFIPLDEDDFINKIENNSKREEEDEKRHSMHVINRGYGSGSQININISQNENLNENVEKEFGDSYGPNESKFIIILKIS
jgi:hypothetical protein